MANKVHRRADSAEDVEALYQQLLHSFYEEEDLEKAQKAAKRLEAALAERPDYAGSIRAEEIGSLIAELRGDLAEAVRRREGEIDRIRQLHRSVADGRGRDYVFRQYGYADLSDRLDILATLYAGQGNLDRAVELLQESKTLCESRQLPFDGQDLLDEYERARRAG